MSSLKKISLSQYITDSIKIAKSFHIYFDTLKKQSSILTYKLYGYIPDDDKNKYILNMAGALSDMDKPISITLDNDIVYLSPRLVKNNEFLKESLSSFDNYYNSLVINNPSLATYIKGCVAGVSLEDVLNARDGQLLWYNEDLFQGDKKIIIKNIQEFIYSFLAIYSNPDYVVDELYAAGMISNLYSILPMVILVEKLNYVKTYTADDFHIYNYFKSYKNLSDEIDILDRKTLVWLYGNLDLLKTYIGHNSILDSVVNNVMGSIGLGIGNMYAEKTIPTITDDARDNRKNYYTKKLQVKQFGINDSFSLNKGKVEKINNIIVREYEQNYIQNKEQIEVEDKDLNYVLKYSIPTKELTKVLPVDDIILTNQDDINKFAYFVNSLIYQTEFTNSKATINFFNPSDGIVYKLNSEQIIVLFLILTFRIFNIKDNPIIKGLQYTNVLNINAVKNFNIDNYKLNDEEKTIVKEMLKDLNKIPMELTTVNAFRAYFKISYDILHKFWYYLSNTNDVIYSTDLLFILNSLFSSGTSNIISGKSLRELQTDVKLPIKDIPDENVISTFKRLLETIIGDNIYKIDKIKSYLNKILKIGEKLTSYTVQFLYSNSLSYIITGHYQTMKPFLGRKSYLTVSDATYRMYEHVDKKLINKNIPELNLLSDRELANAFRMYKPCKLEIANMNNKTMLTRVTDISYLKTGDTLPQLMRPDTKTTSIIEVKEIKSSNLQTSVLLTGYVLGVAGHKEAIGNSSYITNRNVIRFPNSYKPESTFVNGYYATVLNIVDTDNSNIIGSSKLEIGYYNNIETTIGNIKSGLTIPNSYKPISRYKNIKDNDINVGNQATDKLFKAYNPELINYYNVITEASRLKSDSALNNIKPDMLPYNGDADKMVIQDRDNSTKNVLADKPIMKNVPEIIGNRNDVNIYKVNNFTPDGKGIDPSDDIVYKEVEFRTNKSDRKPTIGNIDEITTINSRINNENIKFMSPETLNYNADKDKLIEQVQDIAITKRNLNKPKMKSVPELATVRSDIVLDTVKNFTPDAKGTDPSDDIVYKEAQFKTNKSDRKPSISRVNEITTINSKINMENIRFMSPSMFNYSADKDTVSEQTKDNIINKRDLNNPQMKHVPELTSDRTDVILQTVNNFTPSTKGTDPSDDIVYKEVDAKNMKLDRKPTIGNTDEITTINSRINMENIKFMTPTTFNYNADRDNVTEQLKDNAITKRDLDKPQMKSVPEIINERSDVILQTVNTFKPNAKGSDPSDDIVYKNIYNKRLYNVDKLEIDRVSEISTIGMKLRKHHLPMANFVPCLYNADKDDMGEYSKNNTINKKDLSKPAMKNVPEITTERSDIVLTTVNAFKPDAGGSDPSDDIVYNTTNTNKKLNVSKLNITQTSEIMGQYSTLTTSAVRLYSPIPLMYNEEFYQKETHGRGNVSKINKPILAQTPEITNTDRTDVNDNSKTGMFNPEANGVDPSDDVAENTTKPVKIRNIEEPKIRVTRHEEIEDIPVIKINH